MTRPRSRRKPLPNTVNNIPPSPPTPPSVPPTGKIFLSEEDKRLLQKFNKHIVNKLGLGGSRSIKM